MTTDEAKIVAAILSTADNECTRCVADLFNQFHEHWPQFEAILEELWRRDYNEPGSWKKDET